MIVWREPFSIAAGETVLFERRLPDYPASQGWAITYSMRGQIAAIEFTSVADGDSHSVNVPAATTATWAVGEYILAGVVINAAGSVADGIAAGETHQIYYGALTVTQNVAAAPGNAPETTHYQRMVSALQQVMEGKALHDIKTSRIEMTMIERIDPKDYADFYAKYYRLRQNEIDDQRAKNGQPSRNKVKPIFLITRPYAVASQFGPGTGFVLNGGNQ